MKKVFNTTFVLLSVLFYLEVDYSFGVFITSLITYSLGLILVWVIMDDRKKGEPADPSNLSVFIFIMIVVIIFVAIFMRDSPMGALVGTISELLGNAVGYKYRKK